MRNNLPNSIQSKIEHLTDAELIDLAIAGGLTTIVGIGAKSADKIMEAYKDYKDYSAINEIENLDELFREFAAPTNTSADSIIVTTEPSDEMVKDEEGGIVEGVYTPTFRGFYRRREDE